VAKKNQEKTEQEKILAKPPIERSEATPAIEAIIKSHLIQAEISRQFSGPIPPPDVLREYDNILPGSAERLIKMAEVQSAHRQGLESKVIGSDVYRANAGLWIGAIVAALSIAAGSYLVSIDHDVAGTTIATGVVVSLVGVFVYGTISRRQERSRKESEIKNNTPPSTENA